MELLPGDRPPRRHGRPSDPGRLRPRAALRRPDGARRAVHRRRRALDPRRRPRRGPDGSAARARRAGARSSALAATAGVQVQTGGGIRSDDAADELLESGVARVVLGHGGAGGSRPGRALRPALARTGGGRPRLPRRRRRCGRGAGAGMAGRVRAGRSSTCSALWSDEPLGAVVVTDGRARDGTLDGPERRRAWPRSCTQTALPAGRLGGRRRDAGPLPAGPPAGGRAHGWPARSSARRSSRAGSAWRRGSPRAQRPSDPLPRRRRAAAWSRACTSSTSPTRATRSSWPPATTPRVPTR